MKIELTKEEWEWLKLKLNKCFEYCETHHPEKGEWHFANFIPDEKEIRSIYKKLGEEWKYDLDK